MRSDTNAKAAQVHEVTGAANFQLYHAGLRMRRMIAGVSIEKDSFVVANCINTRPD
ncbi:MAG: hypothetical protein JWM11_2673 [Planctomycetaceae bacterium]|nr:hypothetical protein [Planctomycetaceae bacterium]